jgi:mycofactocin precursor
MHKKIQTREIEDSREKIQTPDPNPKTPSHDIMETTDITIEELSIDGICGVY